MLDQWINKDFKTLSPKHLLLALLASVLFEALITSMVMLASAGTWYVALAGLVGIALLFAGCTIHMTIRIARLKLW